MVILCRRNAGQRRANDGKRCEANVSNFRPNDGGITYLNQKYNEWFHLIKRSLKSYLI